MIGGQNIPATSPPPKSRSAWLSWPAWTGIGSLAALLALGVALAAWWWPQSAESSSPASTLWSEPASAPITAETSGPAASEPATSEPAGSPGATASTPPGDETAEFTASPDSAAHTYLYQLPVNSAGQRGQQRKPLDVVLAGNHYTHSTGMWASCAGKTVPTTEYHPGGKYQHLAGTLGIVQSAPAGMSVRVYISGDNSAAGSFTVTHDQTMPIDLDISSYQSISFDVSTTDGCPQTDKPLVYIGDAVVF
jgi:hypothetical protein